MSVSPRKQESLLERNSALLGDLLDRDVAALYATETRGINKAVRNNPEKFADGYCFTLQVAEKEHPVKTFDRM